MTRKLATLLWTSVLLVLLLRIELSVRADKAPNQLNGMSAHPFHNVPRIQEVRCSGDPLEPDTSVSSMVLYDARDNILASVNALMGECTTGGGTFSSCVIRQRDPRRTSLRTLVMDLKEGETRKYWCEVTSLRSGERSRIHSWSLTVYGLRLKAGPFQGIRSVLEVECSGAGLASDANLVSLTLRQQSQGAGKFLASVNLVKKECTTSDSFSSCQLDEKDDSRTNVRTLVMDLREEESRKFECDVNSLLPQGRSEVSTVALVLKGYRLSYRVFENLPSVLQVTCTGSPLGGEAKVISISLYDFRNRSRALSSVVLHLDTVCSTSSVYSSCTVDVRDSKNSAVSLLVTDLKPGEARVYGCNLTLLTGTTSGSRSWSLRVVGSRMSVEQFQGVPTILALTCSGEVLPHDTKLMALVLFTIRDNDNNHNQHHFHHNNNHNNAAEDGDKDDDDDSNSNIVASMDLTDKECYTSDSFSSCDIKESDSRRSAVKTLVMGLRQGERRRFGCEVSSRRTGGRTRVYSWSVDVRRNRE